MGGWGRDSLEGGDTGVHIADSFLSYSRNYHDIGKKLHSYNLKKKEIKKIKKKKKELSHVLGQGVVIIFSFSLGCYSLFYLFFISKTNDT